jgi:hypothetical protein
VLVRERGRLVRSRMLTRERGEVKKKTNIARGVGAGRSALTRYVLHLAQPQDGPHDEGLGLKQEKEKDASRSELHARSK